MTAILIPPLERRLLRTIDAQLAAEPVHEWPSQSLQLCSDLVRKFLANVTNMRSMLEKLMTAGVEARSFARGCGSLSTDTDDQIDIVRGIIVRLSAALDAASESPTAELRSLEQGLRSLEQETGAFRDLLAEALSRASEAPRPIDWERVQAAEDAYACGETKPFSRQ